MSTFVTSVWCGVDWIIIFQKNYFSNELQSDLLLWLCSLFLSLYFVVLVGVVYVGIHLNKKVVM